MSIPIQKFREMVFQVLYSFDLGQIDNEELALLLMRELRVTKKATQEAIDLASKIWEKRVELDKKIEEVSQSYALERIQMVEKNILRLALFELLYDETIPPKVSIAEAIRLSRKFGTPEASSFVNALLDQLLKEKK